MRKIKGSSSYLKNQVRKNLAKAALSAIIFAAVFALLIYRILSTLQVGILEEAGLVFLLAPLVSFLLLSAQIPHLQRRLEGRKTSSPTLNQQTKRRLLPPKRPVPAKRRRRHRPHRFGTQRRLRFRNQELERQHLLQRRRMATSWQTQLFRQPKPTGETECCQNQTNNRQQPNTKSAWHLG